MLFHRSVFGVSLGALICFSSSIWAAPARIVVLGPDDKPLAGAAVRVLERVEPFNFLPPRDLVTDENGVAILEIDEGKTPRHSYAVRVLAPGFAVVGRDEIPAGETKFQLQPAQKWGGVVLDAAQQPVAGVRLRSTGWRPESWADMLRGASLDSFLGLGLETVTDAQGRYNFDNLPQNGRAIISIADPRFQRATYNLDLSQKEAPPLFVKAGGAVTGRIVSGDGKPLGDVSIAVMTSGAFEDYKSAPDGTFSIGGLRPDANSLRSFGVVEGWVLKELAFEPVKGGETRQLPNWVATRALEVTGQIVDAATKKPLPGIAVEIQAESRDSGNLVSDAQGRFKTLSSRDIYFLRLRSETHAEKTLQNVSIPKDATAYDFGVIALAPGTRVTGTVRDEKGDPPRYFYFTLENKERDFYQQVGSSDGVLTPIALPAGTYTLISQGQEIVSPKTFTVPALGKPFAPMEIIVKPETEVLSKIGSVVGRVLDEAGNPVAGAKVLFKGNPNMGIPTVEAISGLDGRFNELFPSPEKPQFLGIERPGFSLGTGGEVSKVEANWQLGDITLQTGGQIFTARVLQAGKPVAGARVALAGNNWREPALTDESGTFRFEDLPRGQVEFLAASATGFASLKTRGDAKDVILNLETAPAVDAKALAYELVKAQPDRPEWRSHWEVFGAEAMETLALRGDKALGADGTPILGKGSYDLFAHFTDLARRDPARLLERGPQLLPIFRAGTEKWKAEAILARVRAASGDAEFQKEATAWLEREKGATRGVKTESVSQLLAMAEVATKLKRPDSATLVDMALTFAAQLPEKTRRDNADVWGGQTARVGQDALESLLQDFDAPQQFTALKGAVRVLARNGDLKNARLNLQKMEELQAAPAIKAADKAERDANGQQFSSENLLSSARIEIAKDLASTDPAAALQIARNIDENGNIIQRLNAMLDVAQRASRSGQNEVAAAALREVSGSRLNSADHGAQAGAIAISFDPKLGAQLFQTALRQAAPNDQNIRYQPSIATWAYENAPFDPALSRVLLEREWSWRLPAYRAAEAAKKDANEYNYHEGALDNLAWAMSIFNPERALEWVKELPEENQRRESTKAQIAVTLLATPQQRVNFDQYPAFENADY